MSIDKTIIYQNPPLQDGMFFLQITAVEFEHIQGYARPRFLFHLNGNGLDTPQYDVHLLAVLSEKEEATAYFQRFLESFHLTEKRLPESVNYMGKGYVYPQKDAERMYSTIDFGTEQHLKRWTKIHVMRHMGNMFGLSKSADAPLYGPSFIY